MLWSLDPALRRARRPIRPARLWAVVAVSCLLASSSGALGVHITTNNSAGTDGPNQYTNGDVFYVDMEIAPQSPGSLTFSESQFTNAANVNAFALLSNGNYLLSTAGNETLGGVDAHRRNLVEWNPNDDTASLFLDGSTLPGGDTNNIDAAHVLANGNLLFSSTNNTANWDNGDVVEYNLSATSTIDGLAPGAFRIRLSESIDLGANVQVDGISVSEDGDLLLSLANNSVDLGGNTFRDEDIFEVEGGGVFSMFFDGDFWLSDPGGDLNGFAAVPEPSSGLLLGLGLIGLGLRRRRRER